MLAVVAPVFHKYGPPVLDVNVMPVLIQVPLVEIVGKSGMVTVIGTATDVPAQLLTVRLAVFGEPPCHKIYTLDVPCPDVMVPNVLEMAQV
jgi:hypothetical protein